VGQSEVSGDSSNCSNRGGTWAGTIESASEYLRISVADRSLGGFHGLDYQVKQQEAAAKVAFDACIANDQRDPGPLPRLDPKLKAVWRHA